jgi:DNA primase
MIPDEIVEEIRARADIVDVIGEFVALKKAGKEFKANCPFHEERTPSFHVVPDKGFFKCFGCGQSGDVFKFLMERQGMDFVEAVKHVAGRAGVEVREVKRSAEADDPNRPLYAINAFAQDWFRECLTDPDGGAAARTYIEGRGISPEVAERFGVGYAPDDWEALRTAAGKHGLEDDLMLEVGLLNTSDRKKDPYDRFRGRIMFPIESVSGRVIAFGGRDFESDQAGAPKYLNSPETRIYRKGENLYGLSWARHAVRREECALLVEGYMDVVSLAAHGFNHTVASLGTALTPEQARLLARYTKRTLILFDSDAAGLRATFKAGDTLLEAGLHPGVVTLPPGEDPDTVVRNQGPEALGEYLDQAVDVLDRKLQILEERDYFSSIGGKRSALDRLLPTIRCAADAALRDIYVTKVAGKTGVRRETLEEELKKHRPHVAKTTKAFKSGEYPSKSLPLVPKATVERQVLFMMTKGPEWVERATELISPEDFDDQSYRTIFHALLDNPELRVVPASMDALAAQKFEEILSDPMELNHGLEVFRKSVDRIRAEVRYQHVKDIQHQIELTQDEDEKLELLKTLKEWTKEVRDLDPTILQRHSASVGDTT